MQTCGMPPGRAEPTAVGVAREPDPERAADDHPRWWTRLHRFLNRDDLTRELLLAVVVGLALFWIANEVDSRRADRAEALATTQFQQAEVLENTRFVRQTAMQGPRTLKPFQGMNLTGAHLNGLRLGCPAGAAGDVNAGCANLSQTTLAEASLSGVDLTGALASEANLENAELVEAQLHASTFRNATLSGARFYGANLSGADLIEAYLVDASLEGAILAGADLTGANLTGTDLTGVCYNTEVLDTQDFGKLEATRWPFGFEPPPYQPCDLLSAGS